MMFGRFNRSSVVLAAAVAGCGPKVHEARFLSYPPRDTLQDIAVYQTTRPECAFDEVGTIIVEQRNPWVSAQQMLDIMRERARRMGGDAVLGLTDGNRVSGAIAVGTTVSIENRPSFSATVIRFKADDCRKEPDA